MSQYHGHPVAQGEQLDHEQCRDPNCRGWFLSDLDAWLECPRHYQGQPSPEVEAGYREAYEEWSRGRPFPARWAVTIELRGKRWAVEIFDNFPDAAALARQRARAGHRAVGIDRITTVEALLSAECQGIKVEDWESDGDMTEVT